MEKRPWRQFKDAALLEKYISELKLELKQTALNLWIQLFYQELSSKGLSYHPPCFLADEWFVPVGIPAIGIPFYLADPRLRRLERSVMLEVEGGTRDEFLKLIRHEAGHAYSYAYNLHKKARWRKLFGSSAKEYNTETYSPRPYSRSYVVNLENWYAQSHPDEDFAETFAVWLTPSIDWKKRYHKWKGALEKLEYVDALMKSISGKPPVFKGNYNTQDYAGLTLKLKTFYNRKKKLYAEDYPDFYDKDLQKIFTDKPDEKSDIKASKYLKSKYEKILKAVCFWTKQNKYTANQLMRDLIPRCDELNLYVRKDDNYIDFEVSSYITTLISNYLFTGKFKRSK